MLELSGFVTMAGWDRRQMHVADAAQNTAAMRRDALAEGESQVHGLGGRGSTLGQTTASGAPAAALRLSSFQCTPCFSRHSPYGRSIQSRTGEWARSRQTTSAKTPFLAPDWPPIHDSAIVI